MGGEGELFRKGGTQLYLVDGDESVLLQRGEFVLLLVKHSRSPLAAVVAMVKDMQWPVGKDSFVSRLGDAGFSFSNLPARLKFALSFDNLETAEMQVLECLFEEYSTYMHGEDSESIQAAGKFWTRLAKNGERTFSTDQGMPDVLSGTGLLQAQQKGMDTISPKLVQRMQQAIRMSAVAKLFARSVERGAISASTHVEKVETEVRKGGRISTDLALASVDAVAKVVDAVETAGKTLLESAQAAGQRAGGKDAAVTSVITSAWTLNKVGLCMLFRTISSINSSASMRMVSQPSTEASGPSSTASDLGSVSSLSSKSPSCSSAENITAQVHAASLSRGALSTQSSTRPVGTPAMLTGATSRGIQLAESSGQLLYPQPSPVLPPRFSDRAAPRPPSLPPRFYGAPLPLDRVGVGVTTTLSLASGGSAGAGPPNLHVYRPQTTQPMAMGRMPPPAPLRPPPRPRPPFQY